MDANIIGCMPEVLGGVRRALTLNPNTLDAIYLYLLYIYINIIGIDIYILLSPFRSLA